MANVLHEENGKWYFWEETWAHRQGPFETREEAERQLDKYIHEVLGYPRKGVSDKV